MSVQRRLVFVNNIDLALRATLREGGAKVATPLSEAPRLLAVLAALGALLVFFRSDPFVLNILAYAFLFGGIATAWNIIGGFGGQFSLAHGVFFAIGAYLTANLVLHAALSPWLALIPAAALSALIAVAISWPTFRLRGPFFAIATMAFNEVAHVLANHFESFTGGSRGLSVPFRAGFMNMIFRDRMSYALLMLGFVVVCLVVAIFVYRSRLGYSLQAVRDNEEAARACGIDVLQTKLAGMAVSAALTGIGGSLFMMYVRIVDPPTLLTLSEIGVKFALIALIGGVGTIYGPILGALLIVPLESWLRASMSAQIPGAHLIVLGGTLILAALFLKRGLVGAGEDLVALIRRGASRR
jgi:branched-chain amino acid transport system permease protein